MTTTVLYHDESAVSKFYSGRSVFLTGGSGFIGKEITEKLIRSCPGVEQINLLLRPKKDISPQDRLQQILQSPVFDRVKKKQPDFHRKLVVVPGDTCLPGFGISDSDRDRITSNVSVIIHSAASISFGGSFWDTIMSNVGGTRNAVTLAQESKNIEAFVHVSSAYCQIDKDQIGEQLYDLPFETDEIFAMLELLTDDQLASITPTLLGKRPNVYILSKAIAEKLIGEERGNVPVAIIRPSTVVGSLREPFPGWIDSASAANGLVTGIGLGVIRKMRVTPEAIIDVIPVDMTVNCIIAAAWNIANTKVTNPLTVYNFTSYKTNPITVGRFFKLASKECERYPAKESIGKPAFYPAESDLQRDLDVYVRLPLRAKSVDRALTLSGKEPRAMSLLSKYQKLQTLFETIYSHEWHWESDNVVALHNSMNAIDQKEFNINLSSFHWEDFMASYWLGLRKYFLKDPAALKEPVEDVEMRPQTSVDKHTIWTESAPNVKSKL